MSDGDATRRCTFRGSDTRSAVFLWITLALAGPGLTEATPADAAYAFAGGELYHLDLATAALTSLGDAGVPWIDVVALDPSGVLYAASFDELYRIEPEGPSATLVGPLVMGPSGRPRSMAFDDAGRLWLAINGVLNEVDTATGAATAVGPDVGILALAAHGGELWGILLGPPPPPGPPASRPWVAKIDRATGGAQLLGPLIDAGGNPFHWVDDLDFDAEGNAWILVLLGLPGLPPSFQHQIHRAADLESGVAELVSADSEPGVSFLLGGMALMPPDEGILAIPALGPGGLAVFCFALIGCGLRLLRRRRQVPVYRPSAR